MFTENHRELAKEASEWLYKTSESCSVVAVLIATVAFTASSTVPGGIESNGTPVLKKQPAFNVFAIASLVALCFSIASVVMFMAFFTSRHPEKDYGTNLPAKLLVELTSLLISIAAVLGIILRRTFFRDKGYLQIHGLLALCCHAFSGGTLHRLADSDVL
ncbi:hypothetical protein SASPL_111130 [Salvia splendens]|uniref:PGG domain-containing protein n=1 Tax=Salvia splendens TaxID=180675 RepID=A0A8X8YA63_SALSN|nr:hypothetical protein SASPL_111130 [Salvia splendens]